MKKLNLLALVVVCLCSRGGYAAGTFGTFGTATVGAASGAALGGGVTFVGANPEWEVWYDTTPVVAGLRTEITGITGSGSTIISRIPGSDVHWIFGLRTRVGATDSTFGSSGGVLIELMDGATPMATPPMVANSTTGGTEVTMTVPATLTGRGAAAAGAARADLPGQSFALRTFGDRTGTTVTQQACFDNGTTSIIRGNLMGTSAGMTGGDSAAIRTSLIGGGGRSAADSLAAFRNGSAPTNSAATITDTSSAGPCANSTSTTTASLFEYGFVLRNTTVLIHTTNRFTEDVDWIIPLNIRLSFV